MESLSFNTIIVTDRYVNRVANILKHLGLHHTIHKELGYTIFQSDWARMPYVVQRVYLNGMQCVPNIVEAFGSENLDTLIEILDNSRVNYTLCQNIGEHPTITEPAGCNQTYDIYYLF